ncbi:hypothetical protein BD779DRAFT_1556259 [Infundibulicybe gibba]|nr:hypothetical protein BD779DRAFT_1556259 [Infundibulicybe gibba]
MNKAPTATITTITRLLMLPKQSYKERNGFEEALSGASTDEETLLNRHRFAMFILTQRDRPIPSFEDMQAELDQHPSVSASSLKGHIKDLQAQHSSDLQRLYTAHAEEYLDDAREKYLSRDDSQYLVPGENNPSTLASYKKLDRIYTETTKAYIHNERQDDEFTRIRYTHLQNIVPLFQQHQKLTVQEAEDLRRRNAQFPLNVAEFRSKTKDVQLRVARFLTSDTRKQEKMLSEFGWAWRQVQPMKDELKKNQELLAEIQAMCIQADEVRDPRKKPTT